MTCRAHHGGRKIVLSLRSVLVRAVALSLTEFEDFMLVRFDKADVEHNGALPPAEFKVLQNTLQ
jgi:hypothetical protein